MTVVTYDWQADGIDDDDQFKWYCAVYSGQQQQQVLMQQ